MNNKSKSSSFASLFAGLVIVLALVVAVLIYIFVMGNESNFAGNDPVNGHPANALGIIYKGGFIVPILMACAIITITISIERFITLYIANGKRNLETFVWNVKNHLHTNNVSAAINECEEQKGSIGNAIGSLLHKYNQVAKDAQLDKEQKLAALDKELEEATQLEMPALNRNLPILSTLGSVATLIALLGTVIGMIKSFQAMGDGGGADPAKLSVGISEALINTALGIGTSAVAIIFYNYFQSKIDSISYRIEEAGMSVKQTFSSNN
jgi:biopolymer transport protein ExbB